MIRKMRFNLVLRAKTRIIAAIAGIAESKIFQTLGSTEERKTVTSLVQRGCE